MYVCGNDDNILQVERSDGLEYVAGTFVWSGYDYFGESRGYPQTVKCRGAVAVRNAEGETKRTLCCCCSQAIFLCVFVFVPSLSWQVWCCVSVGFLIERNGCLYVNVFRVEQTKQTPKYPGYCRVPQGDLLLDEALVVQQDRR